MSQIARGAAQLSVACVFVAVSLYGQPVVEVRLAVQPVQEIHAVTLKAAGGEVHSCAVRGGAVLVPKTLAMPWTVSLHRFEPTSYTQRDLELKAPLLLRELGELRVRFHPAPPPGETVTVCLVRNGTSSVADTPLAISGQGAFRAALPSGIYAAAFVGDRRATRIRSGVVINPGQTTELGDIAFEPTGSVTLRVVDERSRRPVPGARLTWSPPDALNAAVARVLFSRLWSATTDRAGIATFPSIGPPPLPARWIVSATGYALGLTPAVTIADVQRVALADTPLRPDATVVVDARLPRSGDSFREARLVLSEPEREDSPRFEAVSRQPLRDGENRIRLTRYGRLRIAIESKSGRKMFYQDFDIGPSDRRLVIAPIPTEITGEVRRSGKAVEGVFVTASDRHDSRMVVGQTRTDLNGRYTLAIYQRGDVLLYTSGPRENGNVAQPVLKNLTLAGEREWHVDFELPTAGATIVVVDAESGTPLRARVRGRLVEADGASRGIYVETDADGRATITGAPAGKATMVVRSKGYRGREIAADITMDAADVTVALSKGGTISGRVVDMNGAPVGGARILGGYASPAVNQGSVETSSDASGRFEISEAPESETRLYIVARGQAVAVATLRESSDNVVRLSPPNAGAVTLVGGGKPPQTLSLFLPAPRGEAIIPFAVFRELAMINGMSPFQLLSSGVDGTLILPEFLSPGSYTLYSVRSTGKPNADQYVKVADLIVPARSRTVIALPD